MNRTQELQDLAICQGISGCEDLQHLGIAVEENYLIRESRENRREQGYEVRRKYGEEEVSGRTEAETAFWTTHMKLRELHDERYLKIEELREFHLEPNFDEDHVELGVVLLTVVCI